MYSTEYMPLIWSTPEKPKKEEDPFEIQRKEEKKAYFEELCQKYGTRDWDTIKRMQAEERHRKKEEYEQRKREKEEWWRQNKDRIEAERERRRQDYLDRKAQREARYREARGKPIPHAWRTANRPDGW